MPSKIAITVVTTIRERRLKRHARWPCALRSRTTSATIYAAADPNKSSKAGTTIRKRIGPAGWKTATEHSATKLAQNAISAPLTNRLIDLIRQRAYSHCSCDFRQRAMSSDILRSVSSSLELDANASDSAIKRSSRAWRSIRKPSWARDIHYVPPKGYVRAICQHPAWLSR